VVAARLLKLLGSFQIVACAGRSGQLLRKLEDLSRSGPANAIGKRLVAQGFTTRIERIMAAADIAVTKPGGLTTSECLAMGLPMLVNSPIPGQEDRNCDYLLENGAAWKAHDTETLAFKLERFLRDPAAKKRLAAAAKTLGRPNAAFDVAAGIME
jgi:processive 1,2-diacylglycerol beta-glucosyltransferase